MRYIKRQAESGFDRAIYGCIHCFRIMHHLAPLNSREEYAQGASSVSLSSGLGPSTIVTISFTVMAYVQPPELLLLPHHFYSLGYKRAIRQWIFFRTGRPWLIPLTHWIWTMKPLNCSTGIMSSIGNKGWHFPLTEPFHDATHGLV